VSFTHTLEQKIATAGRSVPCSNSYSGDGQLSRSIPVPDDSADMEVAIVLDVSEIKLIFIKSDQDMTLETNNAGSPVDTISLLANKPYIWDEDSYFVNLLTTDVTKIFLTQSSGSAATLDIEAVFDSTPA